MRRNEPGDRGQSELVGFALVLGVVILTVLALLSVGSAGLQNAKDYQRSTNAEQAFGTLAGNIHDVTRDGAPRRSTEIRVADATLSTGTNETISVRAEPVSGGETQSFEINTSPITYDSGAGAQITYSSGMVTRHDDGSGTIVRHPDFVLTEEAVILPIVRTYSEDPITVGGSPTVDLLTTREGIDRRVVSAGAHSVTIEVTSSQADLWFRTLDEPDGTSCALSGDEVSCDIETDRVSITAYSVSLSR